MPRVAIGEQAPHRPNMLSNTTKKQSSRLVLPKLSEIETATNAEHELFFLGKRPQLESSVSTMNLAVLKDRYKCCDIFPMVKLDLLRGQDKKKCKRVELAQNVAGSMASSLLDSFTGDPFRSKLVLRINITVVSNGCCSTSSRAERIKGILGRGKANGKGLAKLTVSYCLYCRKTGAVAVAKQISCCEEGQRSCREGTKCSKMVLLELEEGLRNEISKEVKFACCSRLPEWSQFSKRMLEVEDHHDLETEHTGSMESSS